MTPAWQLCGVVKLHRHFVPESPPLPCRSSEKPGTCWSLVGSGKMLSLSVMKGEIAMWLCWRTLTQVPGKDAGYSPGTKIFNSSPKAYWVLLGSMWEPALSDLQASSRSGACLPRMTSHGRNFNGSSLTFFFHFWRICFESWVECYLQ